MEQTTAGDSGYYYLYTYPQRYGWICPKCNRGVSPDIQVCPCDSYITYTTSGTQIPSGSGIE